MSAPEDLAGTPAEATEAGATDQPKLSSFPMRVVEAFVSPGKLVESLAARPVWGAAFVFGIVLVLAQTLLIPAEVWQTMFREQMLARGQNPDAMQSAATMVRVFGVVGALIGYPLITLIMTGLTTLIFSFVMGDEGRFVQYLSVTTHAFLITLVVALALVPLRIAQSDPRLTLNLGTFLFFLKDGYLYRWAKLMDLSSVWAWLVVAQGAVAIDRKRSFGSAATVLLLLLAALTALAALLPSTG